MEQETIVRFHKNFEEYAHTQDGVEFWYARELQKLLGYDKWSNFESVVAKAKIACEKSQQSILDHFADVGKMVDLGSGSEREINDIMLTRYACYLVAQNGDPRKEEIAFAMTYFALQTRKQELIEKRLSEWERLQAQEKLTASEKELSGILYQRGVDSYGFARIRSRGDEALFGGYTTQEMKEKLGVSNRRPLADFLPTVTIKAKDLANEITNHNVRRDGSLRGEKTITQEHVKNNQNMRDMLGQSGIIPEELPAVEDLKKIQRRHTSEGKKISKKIKKIS